MPLLLCLALVAAPLDVQTRTLSRGVKREALTLPFVVGGEAIGERINIVIYMTLLSEAPPTGAPVESDDSKWYTSLAFTTRRNDERLLELGFDGETCGADCEPFHRSLTFDARTGRSIHLSDIFTPHGLTLVAKRMKAERLKRYRDQVRRLAHVTNRYSALGNRLTFNEGCLKHEQSYDVPVERMTATFAAKTVVISSERCSTHALREFDDVGEVAMTVAYSELPMTAYGEALFKTGVAAAPPDDPFGQALRGTLGPSAVTMLLDRPAIDGSFSGHYYDDNRRTPIALRGRRDADGAIHVTESAEAQFELTSSGPEVIGKWLSGGRVLDVRLKP